MRVFHNFQAAFRVAGVKHAVETIRQPIQVQPTGQRHPGRQGQSRRNQRRRVNPTKQVKEQSDHGPQAQSHKRIPAGGAPAVSGLPITRKRHGQAGK